MQYEALSYTWGDSSGTTTITVNNSEMTITASLAKALSALRNTSTIRVLWIDQMCINQQDLGEKLLQISLLTSVYRGCTQTVIWLGERDKASGRAIDRLNREESVELSDLSLLLTRPWFRRIWIVQELVLTPRAVIQCGSDILP